MNVKIEHLAIWAVDLERLRQFYTTYFGMTCGEKYVNPSKGFSSYFLSLPGGGSRLELMHNAARQVPEAGDFCGLAHFALSLGSAEAVDSLTARLRADGYEVLSGPRTTGDGYYESAVADPEGNVVELTV